MCNSDREKIRFTDILAGFSRGQDCRRSTNCKLRRKCCVFSSSRRVKKFNRGSYDVSRRNIIKHSQRGKKPGTGTEWQNGYWNRQTQSNPRIAFRYEWGKALYLISRFQQVGCGYQQAPTLYKRDLVRYLVSSIFTVFGQFVLKSYSQPTGCSSAVLILLANFSTTHALCKKISTEREKRSFCWSYPSRQYLTSSFPL